MGNLGDRNPRIGAQRLRVRASALLLLAVAVTIGACGGSDDRNQERPAVPINVSVQLGPQKVTVSPAKFGAGPITLLVANQSGASQTLTIDGPQVKQSVGPINPEDTATLKVSVQEGDYTLATDPSAGLRPARLTVGPKRPSGQNTLLLP
jgi:hypothetical protein